MSGHSDGTASGTDRGPETTVGQRSLFRTIIVHGLPRRVRVTLVLAVVALGTASAIGCSAQDLLGNASTTCGRDEGHAILRDGGLDDRRMTVVDGCTYSVTGLRSGNLRTVIVRVGPDEVVEVLVSAGVRVEDASSSGWDAVSPELGGVYEEAGHGLSFDVEVTPDGRAWEAGEQLVVRDDVDETGQSVGHNEGEWRRYVAWGLEVEGDDYLLMLRLEDGSL